MEKIMEKEQILDLLKQVESGIVKPKDTITRLQTAPFEDIGYAKIDYHRNL